MPMRRPMVAHLSIRLLHARGPWKWIFARVSSGVVLVQPLPNERKEAPRHLLRACSLLASVKRHRGAAAHNMHL